MKESEEETLINNKNLIVNKKDLKVIKNKTNDYSIFYNIKNTNIYLSKIINFNIIQLIYEINKDIFDECNIEIINENEATVYIIMKHYFKEIGFPQKYCYLNVKLLKNINNIQFQFKTIYDKRPSTVKVPKEATLLLIDNMEVIYNIIDDHNIDLTHNVYFSKNFEIPEFVENFSLILFSKMFIRTKQFIENIT